MLYQKITAVYSGNRTKHKHKHNLQVKCEVLLY